MMKVKFKKLMKGARLPEKATEGSAAYDLYVPKDWIVEPGRQTIPLGFAIEIAKGYEALVDPRSGFSVKGMEGYEVIRRLDYKSPFGVISFCPNSNVDPGEGTYKNFVCLEPDRFDCDVIEGKIDSDYRNGVGVIVHNRGHRKFLIKAGTRIAQMTFQKVESVQWQEVEELSETNREGGFGSTGTK